MSEMLSDSFYSSPNARFRLTIMALTLFVAAACLFVCYSEDVDSTTSGTCGDGVTWVQDEESLTISGSGAMDSCMIDVRYNSDNVTFSDFPSVVYDQRESMFCYYNVDQPWSTSFKHLYIEGSVTSIGASAFEGCTSLQTVTITAPVETIGMNAFLGCTALQYISIPSPVETIGKNAFFGCTGLQSVSLASSITEISDAAFYGCNSLTSVDLPPNITYIGYNEFQDCEALKSVSIPDGVTAIYTYAFNGCKSLTSVTMPDSVTYAGTSSFSACINLKTVKLSSSLTLINDYMFSTCPSLEEMVIPDSVTSIGNIAFYGDSSMKTLVFPANVMYVGNMAFTECSALEHVYVPSTAISIGSDLFTSVTFYDTDGTTVLAQDAYTLRGYAYDGTGDGKLVRTLPASVGDEFTVNGLEYKVTSLEPCEVSVIGYTNAPASLSIPSEVSYLNVDFKVTSIGTKAFYGCKTLVSVKLNDVESIGTKAFANCSRLRSVDVGDSLETLSAYAFYGCSKLVSIDLEDSAKTLNTIGSYALYRCNSLGYIAVPSYVDVIGTNAFSLTFADESGTAVASTVEELPGYIYDNVDGVLTRQIDADIGTTCTIGYLTYKVISALPAEVEVCGHHATLRNYSVPETVEFDGYEFRVTKIGAGAFKDYVRIRTISMPYIEEIGSSAFYGCKYIKPADLDSVKVIGYKAFANCASMGAIEFGDSLENVSKYAFYCCSSLETITIPESVTMINAYAFYKCTSLKTLDMECASAAIGAKAFAHCTALEHVTMPDTISSLGSNAFYGLTFKNTADTTLSQTAANLSGKTFEGSGKILTQLA